jgi:hypothetical protein
MNMTPTIDPAALLDREIAGHELLAEQVGRTVIGNALRQCRLCRMIGGELGADGALAIFLLHIGRDADIVGALALEHRCVTGNGGGGAIDERVIAKGRQLVFRDRNQLVVANINLRRLITGGIEHRHGAAGVPGVGNGAGHHIRAQIVVSDRNNRSRTEDQQCKRNRDDLSNNRS